MFLVILGYYEVLNTYKEKNKNIFKCFFSVHFTSHHRI